MVISAGTVCPEPDSCTNSYLSTVSCDRLVWGSDYTSTRRVPCMALHTCLSIVLQYNTILHTPALYPDVLNIYVHSP